MGDCFAFIKFQKRNTSILLGLETQVFYFYFLPGVTMSTPGKLTGKMGEE